MATGSAAAAATPSLSLFSKWALLCVAATAGAAVLLLPLARSHMAGWATGAGPSSAQQPLDQRRRQQQQPQPQPEFRKGQLVWYRQRDGGQAQAKVGEAACPPARLPARLQMRGQAW